KEAEWRCVPLLSAQKDVLLRRPDRLRPVPDHVPGRATDGDDVGGAVAVEVAAAEVLGGDVAVENGADPGRAVEVVHRHAMVLAAVAGEDLVVAVAVHVGDPEGMAVGEGGVDRRAGAELEGLQRLGKVNGDVDAVPGLDGGQEPAAVLEAADV